MPDVLFKGKPYSVRMPDDSIQMRIKIPKLTRNHCLDMQEFRCGPGCDKWMANSIFFESILNRTVQNLYPKGEIVFGEHLPKTRINRSTFLWSVWIDLSK